MNAVARNHSFKNQTGSPVGLEKTGTGDFTGLLNALDQSCHRTSKTSKNRPVFG
jgi:hypothetical protein